MPMATTPPPQPIHAHPPPSSSSYHHYTTHHTNHSAVNSHLTQSSPSPTAATHHHRHASSSASASSLSSPSRRQRWTPQRLFREPSLYDEFLRDEKQHHSTPSLFSFRRGSATPSPAAHATAAMIRAVDPDDDVDAAGEYHDHILRQQQLAEQQQGASRPWVPRTTTTTIVGGPAAASPPTSSQNLLKNAKRLTKRDKDDTRNGGGMLSRNGSSRKNEPQNTRPRTRTLDESSHRDRSPGSSLLSKTRSRIASVTQSSSTNSAGTEYLASVPADTTLQRNHSTYAEEQRAASPPTASSLPPLPSAGSRKIVHLMKTLDGKMSGNAFFRRTPQGPWTQSYCSVQGDTSSLVYESKDQDGRIHVLVPELKACTVRPAMDGEAPYLEVRSTQTDAVVQIRLLTQSDFDSWFAALLYWQRQGQLDPVELEQPPPLPLRNVSNNRRSADAPELARRPSSSRIREQNINPRASRPQSVQNSTITKDAPVIKIGKMIFWDTDVGYSSTNRPSTGLGQPSTGRPQAPRTQSYANKRWRRVSGQLRENGELKLHSDADNILLSVIQLSQLSRCAIQRLDSSVLDCDFCIAIYPQYTASVNEAETITTRPLFLSLEDRVLYEVWFVLLRAFTIPQLYGPSSVADHVDGSDSAAEQKGLEDVLATTTADMFRVERSLTVKIVEAKMYPPTTTTSPANSDSGFSRKVEDKAQKDGYFAEVTLDGEIRGKTLVKHDGLNPLWSECFEFLDLPPVLNSVSVIIKRRPPDVSSAARELGEVHRPHDVQAFTSDFHGGYTGTTFDIACGKVEIFTQELEDADKEIEKWWPVVNSSQERVGDVLVKARAEEGVILMARDYQTLHDLLHRFSNQLTLQISGVITGELKRLCDCLLNIYQVSGSAGDWIMSLVEEEIDGLNRTETPINRLRYGKRSGSNESSENAGSGAGTHDREMIVRDINKNATLEANLLFRGNTLLTKSLDAHMKRVGKLYLEQSLATKLQELNDKDPDCEVDPNRAHSPADLERNWRRLLVWTQEVWKAILAAKHKCPLELRIIFRHIRACAEDRYGDFLRTVSYSSVSGFLFLRFFCPAVLNPKLFTLMKDDIKPRTRRTLTLIAKSLQTMANMASFGNKEHWMEPMNAFLHQHRDSFKEFIDEVCFVPDPLNANGKPANASPVYSPNIPTTETHFSYTTPMTIMQRLPPTSREGFPSLPFLIDQARAFADLVQLWLESTNPPPPPPGIGPVGANTRRHSEIMQAIMESGEDLIRFHEICTTLNARTQECLSRAERAERPNSAMSFHWEEMLDQLQSSKLVDNPDFAASSEKIVIEHTTLPPGMAERFDHPQPASRAPHVWNVASDDDDDRPPVPPYDVMPARNPYGSNAPVERHGSSHPPISNNRGGSYRRNLASRGSDQSPTQSANASHSNISSAVNSDGEQPTALPDYTSEMRKHQERREAAKQVIQQHVEEARNRQAAEKERKKSKTPLSALRKKKEDKDKDKDSRGGSSRRGIDMSHV